MESTDPSWTRIASNTDARVQLLLKVARLLKAETQSENSVAIAATEVFVEKAQSALTARALLLLCFGVSFAVLAAFTLGACTYHLYTTDIPKYLTESKDVSITAATVYLIKVTTAGALAVGLAVFFGRLAHAFLHETMVLYSRRHALRFGRLYVYLNDGKVDFETLQRAFRWNDELSTGFKSMDMEVSTPVSKILDSLKSTIESLSSKFERKSP